MWGYDLNLRFHQLFVLSLYSFLEIFIHLGTIPLLSYLRLIEALFIVHSASALNYFLHTVMMKTLCHADHPLTI